MPKTVLSMLEDSGMQSPWGKRPSRNRQNAFMLICFSLSFLQESVRSSQNFKLIICLFTRAIAAPLDISSSLGWVVATGYKSRACIRRNHNHLLSMELVMNFKYLNNIVEVVRKDIPLIHVVHTFTTSSDYITNANKYNARNVILDGT